MPQCGMVSQAVAFNMFLAFFAVLLTALSLMQRPLEGEGGQKVAVRLSAILPPGQLATHISIRITPGSELLISGAFGWVGTLLVGSRLGCGLRTLAASC